MFIILKNIIMFQNLSLRMKKVNLWSCLNVSNFKILPLFKDWVMEFTNQIIIPFITCKFLNLFQAWTIHSPRWKSQTQNCFIFQNLTHTILKQIISCLQVLGLFQNSFKSEPFSKFCITNSKSPSKSQTQSLEFSPPER